MCVCVWLWLWCGQSPRVTSSKDVPPPCFRRDSEMQLTGGDLVLIPEGVQLSRTGLDRYGWMDFLFFFHGKPTKKSCCVWGGDFL